MTRSRGAPGFTPREGVDAISVTDSSRGGQREEISELSDGHEWPIVWLSLSVSLAIYIPLAIALARFIPCKDSPGSLAATAESVAEFVTVPRLVHYVRPEPLEKARYILALLCIPTLPTFFYLLVCRFMSLRLIDFLNRPGPLAIRDLLLVMALVAWFTVLCRSSELPNIGVYMLIALPIALLIVFHWRDIPHWSVMASWTTIGALALLGFLVQCVGDNWFFRCHQLWHHLDIILGVVNQVAHGKTVLVDTTSQYGILYPYVVAAFLSPFGVSLPGMSVVFATLVFFQAVLLFLAFSWRPNMTPGWNAFFAISYAGLAAPGLSTALFNAVDGLLEGNILATHMDYSPVYFQFVPIRTIWFAVFVYLCSSTALAARRWYIPIGYVLAGLSFLWNADTGLVILLSWTGMLIYKRLDSWRRAPDELLRYGVIHITALAGTIAGSLAFYAAFAWIRSGQLPRYRELFLFQKIFYHSGFYMWPMPLWEFWQPILALLALTIAWCMRQAARERIAAPAPWLFFIAAYGLGMFSYYQGRSVSQVLPSTFLPAFLLAFYWTRQGLARLVSHPLADICRSADLRLIAIKTVPITLFCLCGFVNLCRSLPAAATYANNTTGTVNAREMDHLWAAIRPHVVGKGVAILCDPEAFIHTKTGSWSALPVASLSEVFLKWQLAEVQRAFDDPEMVVVMQPEIMPKWCRHLDLTAFKEFQSLSAGIVILKHGADTDRRPGPPAPRVRQGRPRPATRHVQRDRRRCRGRDPRRCWPQPRR